MKNEKSPDHPYSFTGLSKTIHEKTRLGILTALFTKPDGYGFSELKDLCGLSDGNLSSHLKVLSKENLVSTEKSFQDNMPHTQCRLTEKGRNEFLSYLHELESVLKTSRSSIGEWPEIEPA